MEFYSEVNIGEEVNGGEVNVSDVVPFSGKISTGDYFTMGWKLFQEFYALDTTSKLNFTFSPSSTHGAAETNMINNVAFQCSYSAIKSPVNYWRDIFTHSIIYDIITHITHTNKYGKNRYKEWSNIYHADLINFICVLFLCYIQKRKEKTSIFFSNYSLLYNPMVK